MTGRRGELRGVVPRDRDRIRPLLYLQPLAGRDQQVQPRPKRHLEPGGRVQGLSGG